MRHVLRLNSIKIKNYRALKNVEVVFFTRKNVIIGLNGAGKTTFLNAIAKLLKVYVNSLTNRQEQDAKIFLPRDIAYGRELTGISIESAITISNLESESQNDDFDKETHHLISESIPDNQDDTVSVSVIMSSSLETPIEIVGESELYDFGSTLRRRMERKGLQSVGFPIALFYSLKDTVVKSEIVEFSTHPFMAFTNALDGCPFSLGDFSKWFSILENRERQKKETINILEAVKDAIYTLMSDENVHFSDLHTDWLDENYPQGILKIKKNDIPVTIEALSAGEQSVFLLVSDIARRLYLANQDSEDIKAATGIILIDEIELHLHPQWQSRIVPELANTFPKIQFIVTTHSPAVIQNIDNECIIKIENGMVTDETVKASGRDFNSIFYDVFNQPLKAKDMGRIYEMEKEAYDAIEDEDYDKALRITEVLKQVWGENDPAIINLTAQINFSKNIAPS